jgi:L-iditol 2-dehydrogenase
MLSSHSIPDTMRALVLDGTGYEHLAVREVPVRRPGPGQALARVDAAGICTSLLKLIAQGPQHNLLAGWDPAAFPIILGDEGAVTLVEVGANLAGRFRLGQRCVVQPAVDHPPINHRERYRDSGRGVAKVAVGYTLPGHLAEFVLLTEETLAADCVVPLPDDALPFAHAAIAEPISCCVSAQAHHLHLEQPSPAEPRAATNGLRDGGVTVVLGAGAMGRMHVDVALAAGIRALIVSDLEPARLDRVRELFAGRAAAARVALRCVNPLEDDLAATVNEFSGDRGADDVIVAVGSARAIEQAEELCGRGAVLNLFGGLKRDEARVPLDTSRIHYQETNVTGSSGGTPWDIRRTLDLMAAGAVETAAHITRVGDLEHAPDFLRMIEARELDGKAVVYPHRRANRIIAVEQWTRADEQRHIETARH